MMFRYGVQFCVKEFILRLQELLITAVDRITNDCVINLIKFDKEGIYNYRPLYEQFANKTKPLIYEVRNVMFTLFIPEY